MTAPAPTSGGPPTGPGPQLGAVDRLGLWAERTGQRLVDAVVHHARLLSDPESMVAALIMTVWATLAGLAAGTIGVVVAVVIAWVLHTMAVETGSHVTLWLSTAGLLILVVVASAGTFGDLHPILLAAAGTTVLAHNELIRLNYSRRRGARVDDRIFQSSALAVGAAGLLAVVGVAIVSGLQGGGDRTWLWMPVATAALMAVGFGLSLAPTRRAPEASRRRWLPGERIPPPPPDQGQSGRDRAF